jgi:hypothetical protein
VSDEVERKLNIARSEFDSIGYGYGPDYSLNSFMHKMSRGMVALVEALQEQKKAADK